MKLVKVPESISNAFKQYDTFFIIPHIEPDGDCIGSALALEAFLVRIGKTCHLHNLGPFTRKDIKDWGHLFSGRIDALAFTQAKKPCVIVLDCSTIDRIGELALDIEGLPIIVIDHHSSGKTFGDIQFINSTAPATSLLIQQLIESMGYVVTKSEAEFIMFAFCTDTGFFRHLETGSGEAFRLVSRLVDAGASPKAIHATLNSGAALIGRQHLGMLLSRTESLADGKLLLTWETKVETEAVGRVNRDSDLLYQLLLGVEGVEVVAVLREEDTRTVTAGLRSRSVVDVGAVALTMGGGGHVRASGFLAQLSLSETKEKLVPLLLQEIANNCK